MDADRKKKGLPAFVPRPRSVHSLEPEQRTRDRQIADDDYGDSEVTGLMCDSDDGDGDCDMLEVESQPICSCCFGARMAADGKSVQFSARMDADGNSVQFIGCDY